MHEELLADRYSLMEPLGSGGAGQVWRAWDGALGRQVALKILAARPGDPDVARRAWDEAHTVAGLSHAGIAALYDLGYTADGRPFMVMELVEGWSLAELIRTRGVLAWERAADLGAQVARALAAAHGRGVVHRDVKPANLLVGEDGAVKIVDFGIAVPAGRDAGDPPGAPDAPPGAGTPWGAEAPQGTAAYTAPEVALRHPAGPPADLYGLGCTLYEALAGRPPFPGADAAEVLYRHVHEQPAHLGEIRPDAPRRLIRTVHALLAKNPADRPATATDAARPLVGLAAGATRTLPPLAATTTPMPRIPAEDEDDGPSGYAPGGGASSAGASSGASSPGTSGDTDGDRARTAMSSGSSRRRRAGGGRARRSRSRLLVVGGALVAGAALVGGALALTGGDDTGGTAASAGASPSVGGAGSGTPRAEDPSGSPSPTGTASPGPAPTASGAPSPAATAAAGSAAEPTVRSATAPRTRNVGGDLASALAAQEGAMEPRLYREAQREIAEIDKKLQQGATGKAADKAGSLQRKLTDAREKGRWTGGGELLGLLGDLANAA